MRTLIILVVGLLAVGCGQSDIERLEDEKLTQEYETEFQMSEDENKMLEAEIESNKLKALKAETDKTKKEPPTNPTDQNTTKAKPVKEQGRKLTLEEKKVVGEYEFEDEDRITWKYVLLENGILEWYVNDKKTRELKWKIVKEEIHVKYDSGWIDVHRVNKDKSLKQIAVIVDGKRTDSSHPSLPTYIKIK